MRVKRYLVDTLPDAVSLIRNEMGTDAVILETKEIKVGGFLGMFRKRKIEVMAAVEPTAQKKEAKTKQISSGQVDYVVEQILKASQRSKENVKVDEEDTTSLSSTVISSTQQSSSMNSTGASFASRLYGGGTQQEVSNNIQLKNAETTVGNSVSTPLVAKSSTDSTSNKLDQIASQIKPQTTVLSQTEEFIVNELRNLRKEMQRMSTHSINSRSLSLYIEAIKSRLESQEVLEQWVEQLCEELIELEIQEGKLLSAESVWEFSKTKFLEWLTPYSNAEINEGTRIIQFVGPTGVGKTTSIAKLSANYTIKDGKKLGLITADTYRIAAVEQLRTYANILNIPLEVVFSPLDLQRAYQQFAHADLILMDTAGRNFKSDIHVSEVNSLLQSEDQSEAVLVLSLTSRTQDMNVIAEKFSKYGVRKVVFTKLDEANVYGSIFNMIMMYGLQPIFITSGQNVPDDIEVFSLEKYVKLILGDPHHE